MPSTGRLAGCNGYYLDIMHPILKLVDDVVLLQEFISCYFRSIGRFVLNGLLLEHFIFSSRKCNPSSKNYWNKKMKNKTR